jgi:hypothetical protein
MLLNCDARISSRVIVERSLRATGDAGATPRSTPATESGAVAVTRPGPDTDGAATAGVGVALADAQAVMAARAPRLATP